MVKALVSGRVVVVATVEQLNWDVTRLNAIMEEVRAQSSKK